MKTIVKLNINFESLWGSLETYLGYLRDNSGRSNDITECAAWARSRLTLELDVVTGPQH